MTKSKIFNIFHKTFLVIFVLWGVSALIFNLFGNNLINKQVQELSTVLNQVSEGIGLEITEIHRSKRNTQLAVAIEGKISSNSIDRIDHMEDIKNDYLLNNGWEFRRQGNTFIISNKNYIIYIFPSAKDKLKNQNDKCYYIEVAFNNLLERLRF